MLCVGRTAPLGSRPLTTIFTCRIYNFVALSLTMLLHTPGTVVLLLRTWAAVSMDGSEDLISKPTHGAEGSPAPGHSPCVSVCSRLSPTVSNTAFGQLSRALMAASARAEFLSSLPEQRGSVAAALGTPGQLQDSLGASTCSNPDSPFHPRFHHDTDQFWPSCSYSFPPSVFLWSGILFWRRKPFMLELEYRNLEFCFDQAIH